jgi:acetyl/propionyl-CoA carboxylase alpha subunit
VFRTVLIANRGEIALRIGRACRELGARAVAVYADPDRGALHVQRADVAVPLGGAAPAESYLAMERILEAARGSGAEAIHPGYGFLAENAAFAARCAAEGIAFVGPPAEAIRRLGNKVEARALATRLGIPTVPGAPVAGGERASVRQAADRLGYPLLVKAAAGGGGRGMRLVEDPAHLAAACVAGRREAEAAFGDGTLFLERYLPRPRHVEVQILADGRGTVLALGERECSIQRRHQKLVEETPSPAVGPRLRRDLFEAAVALARAGGYVNAGTVEFLLDEAGQFYFLEVNARLQVEHPITEWVTGLDLVQAQLRIAAGEALPWQPGEVEPRGHAIEARIYAEDPAHGFRPSAGRILAFEAPAGPGLRVDQGVVAGSEVPLEYDPLLVKVSTWGSTREAARRRLAGGLADLRILGVTTTREFLLDLLEHPKFIAGETDTRLLEREMAGWRPAAEAHLVEAIAAAALAPGAPAQGAGPAPAAPDSPWGRLGRFRIGEGR